MDIKICKVDVVNNQNTIVIKNGTLEIRSNGKCRGTIVKVNGKQIDVKRLVIDFDFNKPFADIIFEMYGDIE